MIALFKTIVISHPIAALSKTASIGYPITAVQQWHFLNRCYRDPIAAILETAGIGKPITAFSNRRYRVEISIFLIILFFVKSLFRQF